MCRFLVLCGILSLTAGDPPVRDNNQPGAANPGESGAPADLLEALKDKDANVRLQAAQLLVQMGEVNVALPIVKELLKAPEKGIRLEAELLFKQMGPALIAAQLKDRDPSTRLKAAQWLWQLGGDRVRESVPVLVELLKTPQPEIRVAAALTLTQRDFPEAKAAVPVLVEALKDRQARVRVEAAQRLQQLGAPEIGAAAPVLVELLRDASGTFSSQAAKVLGQMRPVDVRTAAPALHEALKLPKPVVRLQAALALMRLGPAETKAAIPVLIDLLAERDWSVRVQAAQALGRIGPEAKDAIAGLVKLLEDPLAAGAAALALRHIGPDAIAPVLEAWSKNGSFHQPGVVQALEQLGPAAEAAIPKLIEALANPNAAVHGLAARALGQMGKGAVPSLSKALSQRDPRFRQTVADILGGMGPAAAEAIPALTQALTDPAVQVRIQAALALWHVDHPAEKVISPLLDGLRDEDVAVRRRCAAVLAQMEPIPTQVVTGLQAALKDVDGQVRFHAAESLCGVPGQSQAAVLVLVMALTDTALRLQAVEALGKAGPKAKEAVTVLLGALRDETKDHALAARVGWALRQIQGPESAETLSRELEESPKRFRPLVVEALAQTGPAGIAPLLKVAEDHDAAVRLVVVRSLAAKQGSAVAAVGAWSPDHAPTGGTRPQGHEASRETISDPCVAALEKALRDKEREVRREAMQGLKRRGAAARAAMAALTDVLRDAAGEDRILAAETLASVDPRNRQAILILTDMVDGGDLALRRQAIAALGRLGPQAQAAVPVVARVLDSEDAILRQEAALALADMGAVETLSAEQEAQSADGAGQRAWRSALGASRSERILAVLLEVIRERNHPLRTRAMDAVSCWGTKSDLAVSALSEALWDDPAAQLKAAEVLGRFGARAKPAVPSLTNLLRGPAAEARIQAALALWRINEHAADTVAVLIGELKSCARRRPASSLASPARFGTVSSLPTAPPCQQAAEALGQMGPAARAAVPALIKVLGDLRLAAYRPYFALALLKIEPRTADAAVPVLIDVLAGKTQGLELPEQATTAFRREAVAVLGQIGRIDGPAIRVLGDALDDADAGVRREAVQALGAIGRETHDVVPYLKKALADPDEAVRSEAAAALKKIGEEAAIWPRLVPKVQRLVHRLAVGELVRHVEAVQEDAVGVALGKESTCRRR